MVNSRPARGSCKRSGCFHYLPRLRENESVKDEQKDWNNLEVCLWVAFRKCAAELLHGTPLLVIRSCRFNTTSPLLMLGSFRVMFLP
jgi:hypothetical protein